MAGKKWTEDEINYVKLNGPTKSCGHIAEELGRTTRAVQHMYGRLGIEKERAKVGDIVNGWEIIETYEKNIGYQNVTMAKVRSTLGDGKESEYKLTELTNCDVGWPDRRRPDVVEKHRTHGLTKHPLYSVWVGMKGRCLYPSQPSYKNYGGRGITICDEWLNDFKSFYDWATSNGWKQGLVLDRIDFNGNYEPSNCRWVSNKENNDNRSISLNITAFGETKNASDWALDPRCNCSYWSLIYRIEKGWNSEEAIRKPSKKQKDKFRRYKQLYYFIKDKHPDIIEEFLNAA